MLTRSGSGELHTLASSVSGATSESSFPQSEKRKATGPDHRFDKRLQSSWFSPAGADAFVDQPSSLTVLSKVDGTVHDLGSDIASILFDQAAESKERVSSGGYSREPFSRRNALREDADKDQAQSRLSEIKPEHG